MEHETNPQDATSVRPRRWQPLVGLALLAAVGLAGGYAVLRQVPQNGYARNLADPGDDKLPLLMRNWDRPDLALVVSGQMHGYVDPCGCSAPQYGGLTRRYNLVELLRQKSWPVLGVDLGELAQAGGLQQQALLKFGLTMKALDLMGYRAVGVGKHELALPLDDALVQLDGIKLDHVRPLAGSLAQVHRKGDLYHDLGARPFRVVGDTNLKVGVVSLIGPDLAKQFPQEKFLPNTAVLAQALEAFAAAGAEVGVILYHEYPAVPANDPRKVEAKRHAAAKHLATFCEKQRQANPRIPRVPLILTLTEESEPPGQLMKLEGTAAQLLEIGHKGRHVGVVGVYRGEKGPELKYQLVSIGPEFETPPGQEKDNPVLTLMEDYAKQVKQQNLLAKYPRVPHATQVDSKVVQKYGQPKFIGSEACSNCHQHAFNIWDQKTGHSHAFAALENAKNPSHRQYDGECVVCHTVGFRHPTGYYDMPDPDNLKKNDPAKYAKRFAKHNENLLHVGCESCHGPGSAHANNPNDVDLYPLINPYRATDAERKAEKDAQTAANPDARQAAAALKQRLQERRMDRLDFNFCQKCHDTDNDVNWGKQPFAARWNKIAHPTPRAGNQAANNK